MNQKLLDYLQKVITETGQAPTMKEIMNHLNLSSVASLYRDLDFLENKGYIRRGSRWRGITLVEVVEETSLTVRIPLLGFVSAGHPVEAVIIPEFLTVPAEMVSGNYKYFALGVRGESMIDANIIDGDKIILRSTNTAENGQIVTALIDGHSATVKTFRQNGKIVELIPANKDFEIIRVEAERVTIQGVLTGLIRRYQ
jgi:repressor LexA